jgi:hypothetical protein
LLYGKSSRLVYFPSLSQIGVRKFDARDRQSFALSSKRLNFENSRQLIDRALLMLGELKCIEELHRGKDHGIQDAI